MKILLIADVHNRPNTKAKDKSRTLKGLEGAIKKANADLTVFLGDIVHGPDFKEIDEDYEPYLREVLDLTGDNPFAFVFGNHDDECDVSKDDILKIISSYSNSLTNGRNYIIDMMGEKLLFIDSGSYYDGEESYYDTIKPEIISWAKNEIKGAQAILFQHIIVPDIFDVMVQKKHFVPFWAHGDGKWVRFKKDVVYSGKLGERPCPPNINTGQLEGLSKNLKCACFGHDHVNDFELDLMGVRVIQCAGAGYNCYDKKQKSNVKILDTKTLTTTKIYY